MPDISMCNNATCPFKEQCYRFTAKPSNWQSYADFKPHTNENEDMECDYFWDNKCEYCGLTNGNHKISCPTNKVTALL